MLSLSVASLYISVRSKQCTSQTDKSKTPKLPTIIQPHFGLQILCDLFHCSVVASYADARSSKNQAGLDIYSGHYLAIHAPFRKHRLDTYTELFTEYPLNIACLL